MNNNYRVSRKFGLTTCVRCKTKFPTPKNRVPVCQNCKTKEKGVSTCLVCRDKFQAQKGTRICQKCKAKTHRCNCGCGEAIRAYNNSNGQAVFFAPGHNPPDIDTVRQNGKKVWKNPKNRAVLTQAKKGANNPNWMGGKSLEIYPSEFTKQLRAQIRKRDGHRCFNCGAKGGLRGLDVHHIDYDKKNNNPTNLVALCRQCHNQINNAQQTDRGCWAKHYKQAVARAYY